MSRRNIFVTLPEPAAIVRRVIKKRWREKKKKDLIAGDTRELQEILNCPQMKQKGSNFATGKKVDSVGGGNSNNYNWNLLRATSFKTSASFN